jgi:hypothetical protein
MDYKYEPLLVQNMEAVGDEKGQNDIGTANQIHCQQPGGLVLRSDNRNPGQASSQQQQQCEQKNQHADSFISG